MPSGLPSWNEAMKNKSKLPSWDETMKKKNTLPSWNEAMQTTKLPSWNEAMNQTQLPPFNQGMTTTDLNKQWEQNHPVGKIIRRINPLYWLSERTGPIGNFLNRASETAGNLATFGASENLKKQANPNWIPSTTGNKVADTTANVIGGILGIAGGRGAGLENPNAVNSLIEGSYATGGKLAQKGYQVATKGLNPTTKLGKLALNLGERATTGAGAGATYGAMEQLGKNNTLGDKAKGIAENAALFGVGDAALSGAGIGIKKGLEKIKNINTKQEITTGVQTLKDNTPKENQILQKIMEQNKNGTNQLREFTSNSIPKSNIASENMKKYWADNPSEYTKVTNEQSLNQAKQEIKNQGLDNSLTDFLTTDTLQGPADTAKGIELIRQYINSGNETIANQVVSNLAEKLTKAGQEVQAAYIMQKMSPEGMLMYATKQINKTNNGVKIDEALNELNHSLNDINNNTIDNVINDAVNKVAKDTNENQLSDLSNKIEKYVNTKKPKTNSEKEAINTLFKIAKERYPKQYKNAKNPMDSVMKATKNMDTYQKIWQESKQQLLEKYANKPEKLKELQKIFDSKLRPVFNKNNLNKSISEQLNTMGINLQEIIKSNPEKLSSIKKELKKALLNNYNLTEQEANYVTKFINNRFKELIKSNKEKSLENLFKKYGKRVSKSEVQKIIELYNLGGFNNTKFIDAVSKKLNINHLTNEDTKFILDTMKKVEKLPDGRQKDIELAKVLQHIANKIPSSGKEKLQAILRISMLLNPKTLLTRNPLGNVLMMGLENAKQIPATALDKLISNKTGIRTTTLPNITEQVKGLGTGLKHLKEDIKLGVDTSVGRGQLELPKGRVFNEGTLLNKLDQYTRRALQLGDRPFFQAAFNERIAELKKLNKTNDVNAEILQEAITQGLDRTYQNNSKMSEAFRQLRAGINKAFASFGLGSEKFGVGNLILPFTQTPANILKKGIEYSPLGTIEAVVKAVKGFKTPLEQKQFVDLVGRVVTGTGLTLLGYKLAENKLATGQRSKDQDVAQLERSLGKNAYAFKIGNTYQTFDWGQPASIPIAIGVDMYNQGLKDGDITKAIPSGINTLFNQTVMQGITRFMSGYNPAVSIGQSILGSTSQITPTVGSQFAQLLDPNVRETYNPNTLQYKLNILESRIPILRQNLPPKVDVYGDPIKAYQGESLPTKFLDVFINPGYSTNYNPTSLNKEILRLYDSTGLSDHFPKIAPKSLTYQGNKYTLTRDERIKWQKDAGQYTKKVIQQTINRPTYQKLNDTYKQEYIKKIVDNAYKIARKQFLINNTKK